MLKPWEVEYEVLTGTDGNDVWLVGVNTHTLTFNGLPPIDDKLPDPSARIHDPRLCQYMLWADPNRPYLPFILRNPSFEDGEILSRLRTPIGGFPILYSMDTKLYSLENGFMRRWAELEVFFYNASQYLFHKFGWATPFDVCMFSPPIRFGYTIGPKSRQICERQIRISRYAFAPLCAFFTYTISLYREYEAEDLRCTRWYYFLHH